MRIIVLIGIISILLSACHTGGSEKQVDIALRNFFDSTKHGIRYAKGFDIEKTSGSTLITVFDPWTKDTLSTCLLFNENNTDTFPPKADLKIHLPLNRIACLSSSGIGMLNQLHSGKFISAASDAELIYDSVLYNRYLNGSLVNLGNATHVNIEILIDHKPDLILKYYYGGKEIADSRIQNAGIPVV